MKPHRLHRLPRVLPRRIIFDQDIKTPKTKDYLSIVQNVRHYKQVQLIPKMGSWGCETLLGTYAAVPVSLFHRSDCILTKLIKSRLNTLY